MTIRKKSNRTTSLKFKEELIVFKGKNRRNSLSDIDIIAIHEWISKKQDINMFSSLRAIAVLCNLVDGLDELFFDLAKELPNKLILENLTIESFNDALKDIDLNKLKPMEYIKAIKNIIENTEHSKRFIDSFSDNLLEENLAILSKRFKLIPQEDYEELLKGKNSPKLSMPDKNKYQVLLEYANNIPFQRAFLSSDYEKLG